MNQFSNQKRLAEQLTVDGVHDLKRTIGILVLEAFKDKIHIGCDRFSYRHGRQGGGEYRSPRRCNPTG